MRRLVLALAILSVLCGVAPAFATITPVAGSDVCVTHNGASPTTSGSVTSGGNFVVVILHSQSGTAIETIHDSFGNTFTALTVTDNTVRLIEILYAKNATTGGGHTLTLESSGGKLSSACMMSFNIVDTVAPFDQEAGHTDFGVTTVQPGSITPSEANELIVTVVSSVSDLQNFTINSGFTEFGTEPNSQYSMSGAYLIQGAAAAINPTWTDSTGASSMTTRIASFKSGVAPLTRPCCLGVF